MSVTRPLLRLVLVSVPLAAMIALSACPRFAAIDDTFEGPVCGVTSDGPWGGLPLRDGNAVDILFVIDNSGSMAEQQVKLNAGAAALFERLDEADVDYRIGFTTSDNGNPWCPAGTTTPEGGKLVLSPCATRLGDFIFNNGQIDATALACTDPCSLDEAALTIQPTTTDFDSNPAPRPWIQRISGASNLPAGTDAVEAFKCFAPQGINGCGFESQLESMYLALARAANDQEASYGFVRSDALLAVVIVSDEADCSYNKDWAEIFDGAKVFWEDPMASFPTSAVCWNAGVSCSGDPSSYDACEPIDLDVLGNPTNDPASAVIQSLSRYRGQLQGLLDQKREIDSEQDILFTLIAGVEGGGENWSVTYADAEDPDYQLAFGIGPGCTGADGLSAVPPVRMRALAETFDPLGLYSACAADHSAALASLGDRIVAKIEPTCYERCVADGDRSTPQLEPTCEVDFHAPGDENNQDLLDCVRADDGSYLIDPATDTYQVPAGANMCYAMLVDPDGSQTLDAHDDISAECLERGSNLEFVLVRRPGYAEPSGTWIRADCLLSDCPEHACG